jgi:adenosylmethionine-8-amino-7-oxononanoate aminotransferase
MFSKSPPLASPKVSWTERDRQLIWHPLTQHQIHPESLFIQSGQGAYLSDETGKTYLDLISSWWVNLHGHGHPKIAQAIYEQAQQLEQVIFAGFTHEPAIKLCEQLQTILSPSLKRFFFSDNGSTAVEVALKMAYQYWRNQGNDKRTLFLSFEGDYHGDTFGAMSVGKESGYYEPFRPLLFDVKWIPFPETWPNDPDQSLKEDQAFQALELILHSYSSQIAAWITEPLVQGASGMRFARPAFFQKVYDRLKQEDIVIIFDEVMTGFGRTGSLFAWEQIERIPDILCLSKGLTGGFLPLALTITQEPIYEAFLDDQISRAFLHSHSYTANPIGCAAALASLELLLKPECSHQRTQIHKTHQKGLQNLQESLPGFFAHRALGTLAAFNRIPRPQNDRSWGLSLRKTFAEQGLLLRPLGDVIYLMPPYCLSTSELEAAYATLQRVLEST